MKHPQGFYKDEKMKGALESLRRFLMDGAMAGGPIAGRNWRGWEGASGKALLDFAVNAWEDGFEDWADDYKMSADIYAQAFHCWKVAEETFNNLSK